MHWFTGDNHENNEKKRPALIISAKWNRFECILSNDRRIGISIEMYIVIVPYWMVK